MTTIIIIIMRYVRLIRFRKHQKRNMHACTIIFRFTLTMAAVVIDPFLYSSHLIIFCCFFLVFFSSSSLFTSFTNTICFSLSRFRFVYVVLIFFVLSTCLSASSFSYSMHRNDKNNKIDINAHRLVTAFV